MAATTRRTRGDELLHTRNTRTTQQQAIITVWMSKRSVCACRRSRLCGCGVCGGGRTWNSWELCCCGRADGDCGPPLPSARSSCRQQARVVGQHAHVGEWRVPFGCQSVTRRQSASRACRVGVAPRRGRPSSSPCRRTGIVSIGTPCLLGARIPRAQRSCAVSSRGVGEPSDEQTSGSRLQQQVTDDSACTRTSHKTTSQNKRTEEQERRGGDTDGTGQRG